MARPEGRISYEEMDYSNKIACKITNPSPDEPDEKARSEARRRMTRALLSS
jgi:hypothetical protein